MLFLWILRLAQLMRYSYTRRIFEIGPRRLQFGVYSIQHREGSPLSERYLLIDFDMLVVTMRKAFGILQFLILLFIITFTSLSYSAAIDQEITKPYFALDYGTTASRLGQQIEEQKLRDLKAERVEYSSLYQKYLFLSHLYAWRLNNPDVALLKYQELNELRRSYPSASKFLPFELLYIAEIYEAINDYPKARANYEYLLRELIHFAERENDDLSVLISDDLMKFVKYQIDGLHLKNRVEKEPKGLLKRLKLSSLITHLFFPLLAFSLAPAAEQIFSPDQSIDLVYRIEQSPPDLSSMILNYGLILTASASTVDESSEKAMEAYLSKYPESYYSLQLRYLFYKFYKQSGEGQKAERLAKELERIGKKRGMELIIEPDQRFSTPEKSWETFKNALIQGDIDLAMECYIPGRRKHRKVFEAMGRDKMKEIEESMINLHKVKASETTAEYAIIRRKDGKEFSYALRFHNIDGEWKLEEF